MVGPKANEVFPCRIPQCHWSSHPSGSLIKHANDPRVREAVTKISFHSASEIDSPNRPKECPYGASIARSVKTRGPDSAHLCEEAAKWHKSCEKTVIRTQGGPNVKETEQIPVEMRVFPTPSDPAESGEFMRIGSAARRRIMLGRRRLNADADTYGTKCMR